MAFLFSGDWHGQLWQAELALEAASGLGIERIYHVGDFGWKYNKSPESFNKLPELLSEHGVALCFVDGNHENHEYLQSLIGTAERDEYGHIIIPETNSMIRYIQRGSRWEDDGVSFGGLGGAASLKTHLLTEGYDFYPELEQATVDDLHKLGTNHIDVLLMHDIPALVDTGNHKKYADREMELTRQNRELLMDAVDAVKPNVVFSGHWHKFQVVSATTMGRHDYIHVTLDQQGGANLVVASKDFLKASFTEMMTPVEPYPMDGGGLHFLVH